MSQHKPKLNSLDNLNIDPQTPNITKILSVVSHVNKTDRKQKTLKDNHSLYAP